MAALIRIDAVWLGTEPMDMRAGTDTALARVVKVFGRGPLASGLPVRQWIALQRRQTTVGSATARTLDYSLKRWRTHALP